jgi:hypothetical protein
LTAGQTTGLPSGAGLISGVAWAGGCSDFLVLAGAGLTGSPGAGLAGLTGAGLTGAGLGGARLCKSSGTVSSGDQSARWTKVSSFLEIT